MRFYQALPVLIFATLVAAVIMLTISPARTGAAEAGSTSARASTPAVSKTVFSPAIEIDPGYWLVRLYAISNLPGMNGVVVHVPCLVRSKTALGPSASEAMRYWCTAQRIPMGPLKGMLVDQEGQVLPRH